MSDRNLRKNPKKSNRYSSNEYEIPDDTYLYKYKIRKKYNVILEYPLYTFKDYKLLLLKKKCSRP
jgi:hypothetical protein